MPLPTPQVITLPLIGGIDESVDPKALEAPRFKDLRNVLISKTGLIEKRLGFQPMSGSVNEVYANFILSAPQLSHVHTISNLGGVLNVVGRDGNEATQRRRLYSYNVALSLWDQKSYVPEAVAEVSPVAANYQTFTAADVAYVNGFLVYAYITDRAGTTNCVYATVVSATTGEVVFADKLVSTVSVTPSNVRVLALDTTAVIVYTSGANIISNRLTLIAGSAPMLAFAQTTLATDFVAGGSPAFDASEIWPTAGGVASTFIIAYHDNMNRIALRTFTSAAAAVTATTKAPASVPQALAVDGRTSGGAETAISWVAYQETTSNRARALGVRQDTLATTVADFIVYTPGTAWVMNRMSVLYTAPTTARVILSTNSQSGLYSFSITSGGAVLTPGSITHHVQAASKPYLHNSRVYILASLWLAQETNTGGSVTDFDNPGGQNTYYLLDVTSNGTSANFVDGTATAAVARPVVTVLPRQVGNVVSLIMRPKLIQIQSGQLHCTGPAALDGQRTGLYGITFDFGLSRTLTGKGHANRMYQSVSSGTHHLMTAGTPLTGDGAYAHEANFLYYPSFNWNTYNSGAASLTNGATYGVAVIYEFVDAAGHVHRSTPRKTAVTISTGGHDGIQVHISSLQLTWKYQSELPYASSSVLQTVQAVVYLTETNGSIFYRHTVQKMYPQDPFYTVNINQVVNTTAEQLYDTGGEQLNVCPPSATCATLSGNCVWLAGCDDPQRVWVSKPLTPAEAVAFNDDRVIFLPEKIYGIQAMDGAVYCFGTDAIYVLDGDPPDATGAGGSLRDPYALTTDAGCIDARSIVLAPAGIYFQARSGMCLLNRSRQVVRLQEVEDQIVARPFVSSAVVFPKFGQIRWTISTTENQGSDVTGRTLIFDYTNNVWHYTDYEDAGYYPRTQVVVGDTYYAGGWNGTMLQEQTADWTDEGIWVTSSGELGEVHLGGMVGFQRVWRATLLGEKYTDADLTMSVYSDYATSPSQTATFDGYTAFASGKIEPQLYIKQQRCESVRIKWQDAAAQNVSATIGSGRGYSFSALALDIGVEPGTNRGRSAHRK